MIFQTDKRFRLPSMSECGCFVMAAFWHLACISKMELSPEIIDMLIMSELYTSKLHDHIPYIGLDSYVNSYDEIARSNGLRVMQLARHDRPDYTCKGYEQEILVYNMGGKTHATAGDGNGHTTYDPLGTSGFTLFGRLVSKRILAWDTVDGNVV